MKKEVNALLIVVIALIIAVFLISIIFPFGDHGGGMMGGMMGLGWLLMLLPIILIVVLVYALLDRERPQYYQSAPNIGENPLQILDGRYARGELSREEYLRMRGDLKG
jgi:putative membrane protein